MVSNSKTLCWYYTKSFSYTSFKLFSILLWENYHPCLQRKSLSCWLLWYPVLLLNLYQITLSFNFITSGLVFLLNAKQESKIGCLITVISDFHIESLTSQRSHSFHIDHVSVRFLYHVGVWCEGKKVGTLCFSINAQSFSLSQEKHWNRPSVGKMDRS